MKMLLISLLTTLWTAVFFRSPRFDFLDLTGEQFDISWDDITEDLWP